MLNLAYRVRPQVIEDVMGQDHLVGEGQVIWRMVQSGVLSSMILYGPPGVGKTSLAQALSGSTGLEFKQFNASVDGKKELQALAKHTQTTGESIILLIDEIHRLTRPNQDFLLSFMESGEFVVIGATTENPYMSVAPAIRSRSHIYQLHMLEPDDIIYGIDKVLRVDEEMVKYRVIFHDGAKELLARSSQGDYRSVLNTLELVVKSTEPSSEGVINITHEIIESVTYKKGIQGDKTGDEHYNLLSAFQKSLRGSDVDASIHYLARLIEVGDLQSICRRLMVTAYEDVGMARPEVTSLVYQSVQVAQQVGLPEARIPLAFAVVEVALSPKSDKAYKAVDLALEDLDKGYDVSVPNHLKDTHFKGAESMGRVGYKNPHQYDGQWVAQQYLPDTLKHKHYLADTEGTSERENTMVQIAKYYRAVRNEQLDTD